MELTKNTDFIFMGSNYYYYLPKDQSVYFKMVGQDYNLVQRLKNPLKIKVINKEFNYRVIL